MKCDKCFWNYNCPLASGEELTEEVLQFIENCAKYQE